MDGRRAVIKRNRNFVGGLGTASHPSIVQMAWTRVPPLARRRSRKKGLHLWLHMGPPSVSISALEKRQVPISTHPHQSITMSGAWGPTTEKQNLGNVLSHYRTPPGWVHREDTRAGRSAIHSAFAWTKVTAWTFWFFWTESKRPLCSSPRRSSVKMSLAARQR